MADRSFILSSYRQLLTDCWRRGRILLDDIHSIQVFCEVHQITLEEHRLVVAEVGMDARELVDENNLKFEDWLEIRRKTIPPGSGGLRFEPNEKVSPWQKKLSLPTAWQTGLAVAAGLILLVAIALIVTGL